MAAFAALGALGALAVAVLPACGKGGDHPVVHAIKPLSVDSLPATVIGLTVKSESAEQFKNSAAKRPYIDAVALYSLRRGDELQATLQISRFDSTARVGDPSFRASLLGQIGSTAPRPVRMGAETVFLTTGARQSVSVWFRDRYMFILSSREDFDQPRRMLRALLEVKP